MLAPERILDFWFDEIKPQQWYTIDPELDQEIEKKFSSTLTRAKLGECFEWRETPQGRLAEIILLDQLPRNIHRDSHLAFEADPMALVLAQEAHRIDIKKDLLAVQIPFLYMPYMHSESQAIHQIAARLFSEISELSNHLDYELKHKVIIDRFGRYPHRNNAMGRQSSCEELQFLLEPGSSF